MSSGSAENSLVLICDDVRRNFDAHVRTVSAIHDRIADDGLVIATDLYLVKSSILVVVILLLDGVLVLDVARDNIAPEEYRHVRILDASVLSTKHVARFYKTRLDNVDWQAQGSKQIGDALEALRVHIFPLAALGDRRESDRIDLDLEIEIEDSSGRHPAILTNISLGGAFVQAAHRPSAGESLVISLPTSESDYRLDLSARVVRVGPLPGGDTETPAGCGVAFDAGAKEKDLFESFLIAQARCLPWPGPSGRRYERFPVRLLVDYDFGGTHRRERTCNLSRGGVFIESEEPAAEGSELSLRLVPPGDGKAVSLDGRVVRCIKATALAPGGFGVEFSEPPETVDASLKTLLGQHSIPSSKRALIVDDDRFFREIIGSSLRVAGYEVLEARDGMEAIEVLIDELLQLDLLILDLFMPGLTGVDVLEKIRRVGGVTDLLIMVLTGSEVTDEDRVQLKAFGANAVLPKTMNPTELVGQAEKLVNAQWKIVAEEVIDKTLR